MNNSTIRVSYMSTLGAFFGYPFTESGHFLNEDYQSFDFAHFSTVAVVSTVVSSSCDNHQ